jgi:steroid delta-isomerase
MTDIAARTAVCQAYLDGLVAGDLNAVLSLFADDATVEDPVGTEPKVGREALAAFYQIACDFVTAAQLTGTPRVAGNEVAFPFEITTGSGDNASIISIIDAFRFNEAGKIVSMRAWWGGDNVRPA